jgi:hypothetical protein
MDPHHRYIDSWDPSTGVTSYGGLVNESFQDEDINCTIKWQPGKPTAGIYAKRDISINEELLTGYGKPQWIYAIHFFSHLLSHKTIQEATARYSITNMDTMAPQLAAHISSQPTLQYATTNHHRGPSTPSPIQIPTPPTSDLTMATHPPAPAAINNPPTTHPQPQPPSSSSTLAPTIPSPELIHQAPTASHNTSITNSQRPSPSQSALCPHSTAPPMAPTVPDQNIQSSISTNSTKCLQHNVPPTASEPPTTTAQPNHPSATATHIHPIAPTAPISNFADQPAITTSNQDTPTLAPPTHIEYPYGNAEGVGVSKSQIPNAGRGLFGLRPLPDTPHLFAKQGQFICTYATQRHQISAIAANTSSSRYLWSTNTGHRRTSRALYFDASEAHHYGKFINDKWNKHDNNCEFRWNPATGRVEVYALRDILLNEELGSDYDAPFWYQRYNGLTSLAQAQQVQSYYQQRKLPWYSSESPHMGLAR